MRVMFVGDIHAEMFLLGQFMEKAMTAHCDGVVFVGDFWAYTDLSWANAVIGQAAEIHGVDMSEFTVWFIDGNHEDFRLLDPDGEITVMGEYLTYVPRGVVLDLCGVRVGFLGGASSIDRGLRTEGVSWFPAEEITYGQGRRMFDAAYQPSGPEGRTGLDILVTHDTTPEMFDTIMESRGSDWQSEVGQGDRQIIGAVVEEFRPAWHVHGHHHYPLHVARKTGGEVVSHTVCLNCDGLPRSSMFLEWVDWCPETLHGL